MDVQISGNARGENRSQMTRILYKNGNSIANEPIHISNGLEHKLQFGTYEHDLISGESKYSTGLYEILGYNDKHPTLKYDVFEAYFGKGRHQSFQDRENNKAEVPYLYECDIITEENIQKRVLLNGRRYFDGKGKVYKDIGLISVLPSSLSNREAASNTISELERSNRELESFAYVASHDLQEPLRKITTFSSRLKEKLSNELKADDLIYLKRILSSAESMRMLIDGLLEYSRISKNDQSFGEVNLNFVLQQVKMDLELIIDETGTVVKIETLPTIHASVMQIKQLFTNILSNAIKFRKPGIAPEITISLAAVTSHDKELHQLNDSITYHKIQITDNGIGLEDEYAMRIFEIFQRLHGKAEYPGSGIGLAICKKIVEHHNGAIYAKNIPGHGTCFSIILPD